MISLFLNLCFILTAPLAEDCRKIDIQSPNTLPITAVAQKKEEGAIAYIEKKGEAFNFMLARYHLPNATLHRRHWIDRASNQSRILAMQLDKKGHAALLYREMNQVGLSIAREGINGFARYRILPNHVRDISFTYGL